MEGLRSTTSRVILACAIIVAVQAGIAALAHTDSGKSALGLAVRIGVMPVVLLALWGGLRGAVCSPVFVTAPRKGRPHLPFMWTRGLPRVLRHEWRGHMVSEGGEGGGMVRFAIVPPLAGLCLGGLLAVGNAFASRAGLPMPAPRYPFGPEPVGGMAALLIVGALAPLAEELFFRGILLRHVWARRGPIVAVMVSAAAFALAHGEIRLMAQAALGGLIFGAGYVRFRSTAVPILAHIGTNLSYVLIVGGGAQWLAGLSPIVIWGAGAVCAATLVSLPSARETPAPRDTDPPMTAA
jgi:membrane protease YdiL (CAAX protease family)